MSLKVITLNRECSTGSDILDNPIPVEVNGIPTTVEYDMNGVGFVAGDTSSVSINHSNVAVFSEINNDDKIEITFVSKDGNSYSLANETLNINILTEAN